MIGKALTAGLLAAASIVLAPTAHATDDCWGGNLVTPFGSYCDSLPWPGTDIHRHCEYALGFGSCSWRFSDNSIAPQPWDVAPAAGIEPGFVA